MEQEEARDADDREEEREDERDLERERERDWDLERERERWDLRDTLVFHQPTACRVRDLRLFRLISYHFLFFFLWELRWCRERERERWREGEVRR